MLEVLEVVGWSSELEVVQTVVGCRLMRAYRLNGAQQGDLYPCLHGRSVRG